MMLEMFYLYGFFRWTKCIWWALENNYFLVYKLFQLTVEWLPTIRVKAEIIFSSKNHLHYCNSRSENDKRILRLWGIVLSHLNLLLNSFCRLALFSSGIHNGREKKLIIICKVSGSSKCNLPFLLSRAFESFFRKLSILSKIWKWRI